ncbi:MAG: hypothetical protein ACP5SH_24290, partial [Syntrophobacteraceae bacterium]
RLLKREGMMKPEGQKCEDRRKYEAELANEIWHYAAGRIMPGEACSPGVFQGKMDNRDFDCAE